MAENEQVEGAGEEQKPAEGTEQGTNDATEQTGAADEAKSE